MLSQSSAKIYTHQKSNSNANIQYIIQTLGDIQSNRNSSSNAYSMRNNTCGNDSSSLITSNSNSNRLNSFKPITGNLQSQRAGGIAFDCQVSTNNCKSGTGVKRNSSQEMIQPYSAKNENVNTQNINKQQIKQQQVVIGKDKYNNHKGNNFNCENNENYKQNCNKIDEKQQGQSQKASDSKKGSLIHHHGGSKSLDQQTFKRMGSCPNNQVQGLLFNNQLHQSTNQPFSINSCNTGQNNLIQKQMANYINSGQGHNFLTNRNSFNQASNNSNTSGCQSTSNSTCNQMNVQHYLNTNKQNHSQQQSNLSSQYNPSSSHMSNNHTRASSNTIQDYQSAKNFDPKPIKQNFDYVLNQPYISNQMENKHFVMSQDIDDSIEQKILQESHLQKQNQQQQTHQQSLQQQINDQFKDIYSNNPKEKSSSNERIKSNNNNQVKVQYNQNSYFPKSPNDLYFAKQKIPYNPQLNSQNIIAYGFNNNINYQSITQNQIGICDMSTINNSINQRDISMIKPPNIQDISCFSRDQSMFLEANNRDLSINMRDQSSFLHNFKKNPNAMQTTISSGFDLQTPQEQGNFIIQMGEKTEYPTLCNPNLNNSKSLILEGLKDISINYSKVEEISTIIEQDRERNCKQEENINQNDNIFQEMKEFQNDPFSNYEQSQNAIKNENLQESKLLQKIKCLQDENSILREQIVKAEEIHQLKQKDLINQMNKLKQEKEEMQQTLQSKIDSLISNMNQCKKYYDDKLMKLQHQQEKDKTLLDKQHKDKMNKNNVQDNFQNEIYKQIVQQLQQELDIQRENEIIPRIKQIVDKDMTKLVDCLTEMMISLSPDGYLQKKPSLKQIWKWLKEVLKEYMKNTSDLKEAFKYMNAEKQSDFMIKLEKMVFQNESYCKIIEQMKNYFHLDTDQYSNLYELQLFLEKKNNQTNKSNSNFNPDILAKSNLDYLETNLATDSSKM